MKHILVMLGMIFVMNVQAESKKYVHPSDSEISQNRACFENLEVQGCRTQEEDPEHFRSCMSIAVDSLDEHCKKLVMKLYGDN